MAMKRVLLIVISAILVIGAGVAMAIALEKQYVEPEQAAATEKMAEPLIVPAVTPPDVDEMYELVNAEREIGNLAALQRSSKLEESACAKAQDMASRNYWTHNTPDGVEPWVFFKQYGYEYSIAGENLVFGQASEYTTANFHSSLMDSPGHRENIMHTGYTEYGICFVRAVEYQGEKDVYIGVQHFARP